MILENIMPTGNKMEEEEGRGLWEKFLKQSVSRERISLSVEKIFLGDLDGLSYIIIPQASTKLERNSQSYHILKTLAID